MKTKFLIPVLAMIIGIGMSFTTAELGEAQAYDYIRENNGWTRISEIDCGEIGPNNCEVLLDGNVHEVYDTMNFGSVKKTDKDEPIEL